jgi:hypothetical protein
MNDGLKIKKNMVLNIKQEGPGSPHALTLLKTLSFVLLCRLPVKFFYK